LGVGAIVRKLFVFFAVVFTLMSGAAAAVVTAAVISGAY
jgi:hypothetical protein